MKKVILTGASVIALGTAAVLGGAVMPFKIDPPACAVSAAEKQARAEGAHLVAFLAEHPLYKYLIDLEDKKDDPPDDLDRARVADAVAGWPAWRAAHPTADPMSEYYDSDTLASANRMGLHWCCPLH